jgi:hypothetical protein
MICIKSIKNKKISTEKKLGKKIEISERPWVRGDLVQIDVTADGYGAKHDGLGVILVCAHESDRQGTLFPSFYVYNLKLGQAIKYYSYDLEMISAI